MEKANAARGIQDILSNMIDEELFGLASTITQGLLRNKLETRDGAIQAIFTYSSNERSILRRKAVTREILFAYLHRNHIPVSLPITKNELIERICNLWGLKVEQNALESNPTSYKPIQQASADRSTEIVCTEEQVGGSAIVKKEEPVEDITKMALKFSEWFYSMMNQNECIGAEHFWQDARLTLNLSSNGNCVTEIVENNPADIVQLLFRTKSEHCLYFNPNCSKDGVQGRTDPHGLVVVLSCGTLHRNNICAGIFEQVFMLARDPFSDNNWKIKTTELNLRSKTDVCELPRLCDNNLTSNLLALPMS